MKAGDRVRLSPHGVRVQTNSYDRHKVHIDWRARRGTLVSLTRRFAYVIWDGVKHQSQFDIRLIESDQ